MRTKRALLAAVVCGSIFGSMTGLVGCKEGSTGTSAPAVAANGTQALAVVNLNKVATDLGWDAKLTTAQSAYEQQLRDDLQRIADNYKAQVTQYVQSLVPPDQRGKEDVKLTLTPEQTQNLQNMSAAAQQQFAQKQQQANQMLQNFRVETMKRFGLALSPIVSQVAREHKVNTILSPDSTLFVDDSVNLTTAVSDAALKARPDVTPVTMDHLSPEILNVKMGPTSQPATKPATAPGK